jgi:phospholipid transport system substrate-binding protein
MLWQGLAMMRRIYSVGIGLQLLACTAGPVFADASEALAVVQELTEEVYQTLQAECRSIQEEPERLYTLVEQVLSPHADLRRMSRWVLGRYWRDMNERQRREFEGQFRQLLVRTYATAIQTVSRENIHFLPPRGGGGGDKAIVRTEIRPPGEPVVGIDYAMHREPRGWLVHDVRVEGVSLVASYRTTFGEQIRAKGAAAVIDALEQRNRQEMSEETAGHIRSLQAQACAAAEP